MTQEEKDLLLKDLCARLPYGVKLKCEYIKGHFRSDELVEVHPKWVGVRNDATLSEIGKFLPYLRPMSSMTEDEAKELLFVRLASKYGESCAYIKNFIKLNEVSFQEKSPYEGSTAVWFSFENKIHDTPEIREYSKREYLGQINDITIAEIDWLNAHHFDYHGLIEKGLAIEAPEGMYKKGE